jgi:poly(3-hydroxybutyrate) depolymerase
MRKLYASICTVGFIAAATLMAACSTGEGDSTGMAGTGTTGSAGTTGSGGTTGSAGTTAAGGTTGSAGTTGSGGTTGSAGTTAAGGTTGSAGTGAGQAGTGGGQAGTGGGQAGTGGTALPGRTAGCEMPPPNNDSSTTFVKHDIMVTGVDQGYINSHTLVAGNGAYTFTNRNYYLRLPPNYDPSVAYGLAFGGGGCGGNATVGQEGGYLPGTNRNNWIQVSMSYVPTQGATNATNPGACFADSGTNTPEVAYFDAILKEVSAKYCVNAKNVVVSGYSSGAWEAFLMGYARAGVVRGIATEAGGMRLNRPAGSGKPVAAFIVTTKGDNTNPADLTPGSTTSVALGALGVNQARDEILTRNGCTDKVTTAKWTDDARFPLCVKYTGCPANYPVVYCVPDTGGHYPAHPPYTPDGMYKFLSELPAL